MIRLFDKSRNLWTFTTFLRQQNVLVFNTLSTIQEDAMSAGIINPGEDRTIYQSSTLRTFTIQGADTLAQNNVAIEQKQKRSAVTKYNLRSVLHQATRVLIESSRYAKFAQLLRDFSVVLSRNERNIAKSDLVQHRIQVNQASTPGRLPYRQLSMDSKSHFSEKLDKLREDELIELCHSPYSEPAMII